ncbi:hypothetical protein ABIC83_002614 [Roseateles asaccharophilus]|uniref:hypothetical protein n=1 Tax=Roseateles asaccharophilus TaxID=582607 RepID=UPI003834D2D6
MLSLSGCTVTDGVITANYEAVAAAGGKDQAERRIPVVLVSGPEGVFAKIDLEALTVSQSEDDSLDALAEVMEAAAQAIRNRGEPTRGVPYFG